jgi:hypothetical protein
MASLELLTFCRLGFPGWWWKVTALFILTCQGPIADYLRRIASTWKINKEATEYITNRQKLNLFDANFIIGYLALR